MTVNNNSTLLKTLIQKGLIDGERTFQLINEKARHYNTLPELLINEKLITSQQLADTAASIGQYLRLDLTYFDPASIPDELRNEKLIQQSDMLPLRKHNKTLYLAVVDPTDISAITDFEFNTGLSAEIVIVDYHQLHQLLNQIFDKTDTTADYSSLDFSALGIVEGNDYQNENALLSTEQEDQPIIYFLNKVLLDAIRQGASDLHFEPYEKHYRIRFRIDGLLTSVTHLPAALSTRLSARLKIMSRLDIAEKRVPQDGRVTLQLAGKKSLDCRVSTLPTLWGEKIVMRLLNVDSAMLNIEALGYEAEQKHHYLHALRQPQGMILVTGPTGSGKTLSLYTGLASLNTEETNISTAEDPVEINLPGINQVQINPKSGLTFASALRAFLRQDPDVVMVGEIRDLETAEIAIKAAQTGHLVLSTLHTNSAPETLTRLLNMGVPAYNVASSVSLIIAQRLARKLCCKCKTAESVPPAELRRQGFAEEQLTKITLFKAVGCQHCTNGYKGRIGIYEVMPISAAMATIIMENGNAFTIAQQAQREGMLSLRESGLRKVAMGVTSLAEINRITKR